MASISLPPQSRPGFHHFDTSAPRAQSTRRLTMPPLPNPPFVFPFRDPEGPDSQAEMSQPRAPPALPAFSFNPGLGQSLQPPSVPIPRPNGHRRRPSEYVGGDQLVTPGSGDTGDKREESSPPSQPSAPSGPSPGRGPGRRHHAHRRSAAVSGVDLNAISKALGTATGAGTASCPPGDRVADNTHEDTSRPLSFSAPSLARPTPPASPQLPTDSSIPPVPPIPASIHIEPAPIDDNQELGRPVSAVFHEPPVISDVSSNQPSENLASLTPGPTPRRKSKPRPKTADASLAIELMQTHNIPDVPTVKRSKSTGHSRSRKSRSTGHLSATLANQASDDAHSTDTSRPSLSDDGSETTSDVDHDEDTQTTRKSRSKSKKKKRVRSWAGSLLTRGKSKRHPKTEDKTEKTELEADSAEDKPHSTPPTLVRTNSEVGSVVEVDFDNDDVVVLRTPTNPEVPITAARPEQRSLPTPTLETAWKPRSFYEQNAQVETLSSPVIDLDAALGPFNTPDMRATPGCPSNFSVATQRMYSGGRRGEFVGPEMRYHRRTESAPVMQPFDRSALHATRLGVNGTGETPDVFDEEEEDEFLAANQSPRNGRVEKAPEPQVEADTTVLADDEHKSVVSHDSVDTLTRAPQPSPEQHAAGLGIRATDETQEAKREETSSPTEGGFIDSTQPAGNPFAGRSRTPVEILKSEESASKAMAPSSPDVSPRYLAVDKRPATSPHELLSSVPSFSLSAGVSPSDLSFPSPDVPSRTFDDRQFSSHSYHHLPSEYPYASVEDVPSLSSSASTMTNRFSTSFFPRSRLSSDRAASFSATVHRRTSQANASKRSSLASLSKLVGGAHPERSKLNQEEKPPGDMPDKTKKRHRRLSRLMQFWKPRDKDKTDIDTAPSSERPF